VFFVSVKNSKKDISIFRFLSPNHTEGVYTIKPQEGSEKENTPTALPLVKIYAPRGEDIHGANAVMICQACGLDKKRANFW
jgi:hypothetical protein